jgi:hypothetical protein
MTRAEFLDTLGPATRHMVEQDLPDAASIDDVKGTLDADEAGDQRICRKYWPHVFADGGSEI